MSLRYRTCILLDSIFVAFLVFASLQAGATTLPKPFVFFNQTQFANRRLLDTDGAMRATTVYDEWSMSCSATACTNLPDQATFLAQVAAYLTDTSSTAEGGLGNSFLIVLDFENLVVDKATSQAQANLDKAALLQFASWVHNAYPSAKVGLYDYDYSTTYQSTRAALYASGGFDVFAPTLYQRWADHTTWNTYMEEAVTNDRAISSTLPIYPFISPYVGAVFSSGLVAESDWSAELSDLIGSVNGAILWTQYASNGTSISSTDSWYVDLLAVLSTPIDTTQVFAIKNEHNGLCAAAQGSVVTQATCATTATPAQQWQLQRTTLDTYYLVNVSEPTLYLSVASGSTVVGAGLELDEASSTTPDASQTWHVVSGGAGYYTFIGDASNLCVLAPSTVTGVQMQINSCTTTSTSQLYSIRVAPTATASVVQKEAVTFTATQEDDSVWLHWYSYVPLGRSIWL
ncbi:MAG: RICIN domain-containing protein [Acidobacteriaceae bacterium]|nr:RICIN domain-containing protein [Acidobacteriaceae bacterium]